MRAVLPAAKGRPRGWPAISSSDVDCERCSAELPEGGRFCSNCGEPRPDEAVSVERTQPCRDCAVEVQLEAVFCWNCGTRSPHLAPAVTGNTVVRKAAPDPKGPSHENDFEWEDDRGDAPSVGPLDPGSRTMRRGSGSPPFVPAEPTLPKSVRTGVPSGAPEPAPASEPEPDPEPEPEPEPVPASEPEPASEPAEQDQSPTLPRKVVSMIAEELGEDPSADPTSAPAEEVAMEGSEPLSLEPDVDAAIAQARKALEPVNVSEEVAELQFLMLRGFRSKAREAYQRLIEAHPGHPDLLALGEELNASPAEPAAVATQDDSSGTDDVLPQTSVATVVTVVTRTPDPAQPEDGDEGSTPREAPTSPTFVDGTSPPTGGFAAAGLPDAVAPNVTPRLGIESPERWHRASSESLPTNPRMPSLPSPDMPDMPDIDTTAVSKPAGVRVVMLGARGEAVWERLLVAGEMLEVGRGPDQPWGDDPHIEPSHARLFVIPGGGLRIEATGRSGVFRQVDERLAVRDGDEFRVGESLLRYSADGGGWGAVTSYPMSGTTCSTAALGGSGLIVGRESADIELPEDTFVSGAHCRFTCRDEGLFIEDMGSANGTYSRLRPGEAVPYGSLLLLGQTQFKVRRPAS